MRVLVGWDDRQEAETIDLFLNVEETSAHVATDADDFRSQAESGTCDVVLLAINFPSEQEAYALFERVRRWQPEAPVIAACFQGEVIRLARFISNGLHSYLTRDAEREFIFLLMPMIESAYAAVLAERSKQLAERLRQEIDSVRQLQESVIPRDLPTSEAYRVAARYEPAQIRVLGTTPVVMAGGDYYDVFSLDGETMILLVGDAAGHGVKACMSIMTMHTLIRMIRDHRYQDTGGFVTEVNARLAGNDVVQDEGGFITLMYCALNTESHQLQFTSAGHPMPLLQDLATNVIVPLGGEDDANLPLGIDDDVDYAHCVADVPPNSRVLIYTDGIAEAFPAGGERTDQFGEEGIYRSLQESAGLPLAQALDKLFADSHAFTAGVGPA